MPSFNDHFIENMTGKEVIFDVQPYEHGNGIITKMTPRMIKGREFCPHRGQMNIEYEVFDITIGVSEGRRVGALWGGVAVQGTIHDQAGKITHISGVTRGQIYQAVEKGQTIVIARCG